MASAVAFLRMCSGGLVTAVIADSGTPSVRRSVARIREMSLACGILVRSG